jgi:mRNA interferase RelE/StbE
MQGVDKMKIRYSNQADAYLDKQTEKQTARIRKSVGALPVGDVKKLRGIDNGYRLRVGNVRVLFVKEDNNINVFRIDNRGDVYK